MTYEEKLKDPRWQRKRLEVFERDNWTCRECGWNTKPLAIHHVCYLKNEDGSRRDPWDYPARALATVCEECHAMMPRSLPGIEESLLDALRENGFLFHDIGALIKGIYMLGRVIIDPWDVGNALQLIAEGAEKEKTQ